MIALPPKYVLQILEKLTAAGYEAYMVGGCVRDTLMRRRPNDWDITTSAEPDAVVSLFDRTVPTGIRHGTVTVLYGRGACEVTTYRLDGGYSNHRRPDGVRFTSSLEADLSRRDFTVNAMAMDASGGLRDPFGGREDISSGLIRCVGEPERRFSEDALRMLRAVRFAAKLGFEIEGRTLCAMLECANFTSSLSAERVAGEIRGILSSPRPDYVWSLVDFGLIAPYLSSSDIQAVCREPLAPLPGYARLAHWCAALLKSGYIMSTELFLRSLKFDNRAIKTSRNAVEILRSGSRDYKRLLRDYGRDAVLAAYPKHRKLRAILRSNECWSLDSLAINGEYLSELGYSGKATGDALRALLDHVIDYPEDNEFNILCKLAQERKI